MDAMEDCWDDMEFAYMEFQHHGMDEELALMAEGQYLEELCDD